LAIGAQDAILPHRAIQCGCLFKGQVLKNESVADTTVSKQSPVLRRKDFYAS
jgi:hypothetical protein